MYEQNTVSNAPQKPDPVEIRQHEPDLARVARRYAVAITAPMLDLIDPTDTTDPIALQFLPDTRELEENTSELTDPIGDHAHSPLQGIVHRYPDRVLLTPLKVCPVYCRFCFRRDQVGNHADPTLSKQELSAALKYIREHDEIWEVILSGGDPLILSPRRLKQIIRPLEEIEHVKVIRIHTRVPAVDPERINEELLDALKCSKALFVVLHSNHPRELTTTATAACAKLIDAGIPMLSQTVLLKGVNDDPATLEKLLRTLVENRIKPYYLHHLDRARGTGHFRTTLAEGQVIMRQLRGRVSGLCQPEYVLDIPGGAGKVPVGPVWISAANNGTYVAKDYQGTLHQYTDDAAESMDSA
jgi:lysine 2,3-aminomutase